MPPAPREGGTCFKPAAARSRKKQAFALALAYSKIKAMRLQAFSFAFLALSGFALAGCSFGGPSISGRFHELTAQPLSLHDPNLRVCVFDPGYRILHFPMWHFPIDGQYTVEDFERISKSQFQLLHTILAYSKSRQIAVFDEGRTSDLFDETYSQILRAGQARADASTTRGDGRVFRHNERLGLVRQLFGNGIPQYYEYLNQNQKSFLFDMGASFTLYFLGKIPKIYKVIEEKDFDQVKTNLFAGGSQLALDLERGESQVRDYWVYDFRERKLRDRIAELYRQNPGYNGIVLIAYGANHDFSDDFAGWPFQSGQFCLNWVNERDFQQRRL